MLQSTKPITQSLSVLNRGGHHTLCEKKEDPIKISKIFTLVHACVFILQDLSKVSWFSMVLFGLHADPNILHIKSNIIFKHKI